jgi:hypothetical protein
MDSLVLPLPLLEQILLLEQNYSLLILSSDITAAAVPEKLLEIDPPSFLIVSEQVDIV